MKMNMNSLIFIMALSVAIAGCSSMGQSQTSQRTEKDSVALPDDSEPIREFFSKYGELTWNEIYGMDYVERRRFLFVIN